MTRLLRVAGWGVLAALLGWLCIVSLLDRLAQHGLLVAAPPSLSYGGSLLAARAEVAWRAGDLDAAQRLSRDAVARRPVDAAALRLAGFIAIARGDGAAGEALMRLAGAAGWRDRGTQAYWADAATQQNDWAVAIDRVEALARVGDIVDVRRLLRPIEASPDGRSALLRRWRAGGDWLLQEYGVWPVDDAAAMANRYAVVRTMVPSVDREDRDRLATGLIANGRRDWAFAVVVPDERRLFFTPSGQWTPLGWNLSASVGVEATVVADGEKLRIVASGPALLPFAERLIRLPPGGTLLDLPVEGARTDLPLVAMVDCVEGNGATAVPTRAVRGHYSFALTVPADCRFQKLTLAVAGEEARRGADLTLHPPTLSRAAAVP